MTKKRAAVFFSVLFCLSIIPVFSVPQEIEIKKENGIIVIYNPLNPVKSLYSADLKKDLVMGAREEGPCSFEIISDIKADSRGRIYVVDEHAHSIKVFDKKGNYLKVMGRKGQGPGEFIAPVEMAVLKEKIAVYSLGRISYFDLDGDFLNHNKVMFGRTMVFDTEGNVITLQPGPPEVNKNFLKKFNPEGELILTLAETAVERPAPGEKRSALPPTLLFTARENDDVVWAHRDKYEVHVVDKSGKKLFIINKEYNPVELTEKHKQRFLEHIRGEESRFRFPEHLPPIRYITSDEKNRIWICTYETREEKYVYDIFDSEGRLLGRAAVQGLPMSWEDGFLYCRGEDENGLHHVLRYKVEDGK